MLPGGEEGKKQEGRFNNEKKVLHLIFNLPFRIRGRLGKD